MIAITSSSGASLQEIRDEDLLEVRHAAAVRVDEDLAVVQVRHAGVVERRHEGVDGQDGREAAWRGRGGRELARVVAVAVSVTHPDAAPARVVAVVGWLGVRVGVRVGLGVRAGAGALLAGQGSVVLVEDA